MQTFRRVAVAVKEVKKKVSLWIWKKYEPFDKFQDIPPRNPRNELTSWKLGVISFEWIGEAP
jgi:hypothetical protein